MPEDVALLQELDAIVGLAQSLPFEVDVWKLQNVYYELLQTIFPEFEEEAHQGYADARAWVESFQALGRKLRFRV
jgi:hypothetical protein